MSSQEPKKVVYLIRHGQSNANVAPIFQSDDSPLSEAGKKQATAVESRIAHLQFEALITSPLSRARQTADAIAHKTGKQVEISDLFVERAKPTSIFGKPYVDATAHDTWQKWQQSLLDSSGHKVEDSENYSDIVARAGKALDYLQSREETSIVVVTHHYFICTLVACVLLGPELSPTTLKRFYERLFTENSGITVLHFRDAYAEPVRWRLWSLNDHAHFAG